MTELYAIPVDRERLVVRRAPETPLVVIPTQTGDRAQVFVAQRQSRPPLPHHEAKAMEPYFDWVREGAAYWWRTLRPALVSLERVTSTTWSARLEGRGEIISAGDDPRHVPSNDWLFRTLLPFGTQPLRDPHGPQLAPDARGETLMMMSEASRVVRAVFPSIAPEPRWVRVFNEGYERDAHLRALRSEVEVLANIAEAFPGAVTRPVHDGVLATALHRGRYVATELPVGLSLNEAISGAGQTLFPPRDAVVHGIAVEAARMIALVHMRGYHVGPLSPSLLRVRPSFTPGAAVRITFVALPGAGAAGDRLPPSILEQFPEAGSPRLVAQFDRPYRRTVQADMTALGHLIAWVGEIGEASESCLGVIAADLMRGKVRSASRAVERLKEQGSV